MDETILIALGSNRRHGRHGAPPGVIAAAIAAMAAAGLVVAARSRVHATTPLGPGGRRFANAVVAVRTPLALPAVLAQLQRLESDFGRRRGRRWGDRVLDLDILAAGASEVALPGLTVPHPELANRRFVLDPLVEIAADWRHPRLGLSARALRARLLKGVRPAAARRRAGRAPASGPSR